MIGPSGQITVITHNGKMPKDGGHRLGYACGENFYPIGSATPIPLSAFRRPEPKKEKPKPPENQRISHPEFYSLSHAKDYDGECCECGRYPNPTITVEVDGRGRVELVKCRGCGRLMRPRD